MPTVIGVPKEVKDNERRVSMQPDGIRELIYHGHRVVVEARTGKGAGFEDAKYEEAEARLVGSADEVFDEADLVVKVKEPVPDEYDRYREGQPSPGRDKSRSSGRQVTLLRPRDGGGPCLPERASAYRP